MARSLNIVLADPHTLVRSGVRLMLEKLGHTVREATTGNEVLRMVKAQAPDIVITGVSLPELNGLETTDRLARDFPEIPVIVLSMHDNDEFIWRALKCGATAYVLKRSQPDELQKALDAVNRHEIYLCRELSNRFLKKFPLNGIASIRSPLDRLSGRQREVLQLIAEGHCTKEIAAALHVSPKTAEYHRDMLQKSLGIFGVAGLVRFAYRVGLVSATACVLLCSTALAHSQPPPLPKIYKPATGVTKGSGATTLMQVVPQAVVVPPKTYTFSWCYPSGPGSDYSQGFISFNVYHSNFPSISTMTLLTNVTQMSVTVPPTSPMEFFGVKAYHNLTHRESDWGSNEPCNN